jgi:hypothetical protein
MRHEFMAIPMVEAPGFSPGLYPSAPRNSKGQEKQNAQTTYRSQLENV